MSNEGDYMALTRAEIQRKSDEKRGVKSKAYKLPIHVIELIVELTSCVWWVGIFHYQLTFKFDLECRRTTVYFESIREPF